MKTAASVFFIDPFQSEYITTPDLCRNVYAQNLHFLNHARVLLRTAPKKSSEANMTTESRSLAGVQFLVR